MVEVHSHTPFNVSPSFLQYSICEHFSSLSKSLISAHSKSLICLQLVDSVHELNSYNLCRNLHLQEITSVFSNSSLTLILDFVQATVVAL